MKQLVGILLNPKNMKGTLSNEFVRGWSAYDIAVKNGFEGTEQDFIDSLKGETIDLRVVGTLLQYKHENDEEWSDLVDLNGLDYELMSNLPTVNGTRLTGEISALFMLPADEISENELNAILNS